MAGLDLKIHPINVPLRHLRLLALRSIHLDVAGAPTRRSEAFKTLMNSGFPLDRDPTDHYNKNAGLGEVAGRKVSLLPVAPPSQARRQLYVWFILLAYLGSLLHKPG